MNQEVIKRLKYKLESARPNQGHTYPVQFSIDDMEEIITLLATEPEPSESEKSPMMSDCWLIHPIDDIDCEPCPNVGECREVRGEVDRLTAENKAHADRIEKLEAALKNIRSGIARDMLGTTSLSRDDMKAIATTALLKE